MAQPAEFYQGDRIRWIESRVAADATAVTVWLRAAAAGAGVEATATDTPDGWEVVLSAQTTATMAAGSWDLQVVSTVDGAPVTTGRGSFTVRRSLAFTGTAGAFDDRSQAQRDLAAVEEAIRALSTGAQEYQIGGRMLKRYKMSELLQLRDSLRNEIAMERKAEKIRQGLGNPGLAKVRFV